MSTTITITQWLVRVTGVLLLILGLLIWTERMENLIGIHILLGVLMVLSLWLLAGTASTQGVPVGMAIGAAVIGLIALLLGMTQRTLLPDPGTHWIIQGLHLLIGMIAVGTGEMIGGRLRRQRLAATA
jgi:hypothetical protein